MDMSIRPLANDDVNNDIAIDNSDNEEGLEAQDPSIERNADDVEEIFVKELPTKSTRKPLSEAQLEGLKKGREKMKARRRQKLKDDLEKELERERSEKTEVQERKKEQLPSRLLSVRKKLLDREMSVKKEKKSRFTKLKYQVLESMESVKDFDRLSDLLDEIDEEDIYDDEVLKTRLNDLFQKVLPSKTLL